MSETDLKKAARRWETKVRHGEQARSSLRRYAEALCKEMDIDPDVAIEMGPVKSLKRIFEKAATKYSEEIQKISDICRCRIYFNNAEQIKKLRKIFGPGKNSHPFHQKWLEQGTELYAFKDYFARPKAHGYVGINIKIDIDIGKGRHVPCEIQIWHRDMQNTYKLSIDLYEKIRKVTDVMNAEGRTSLNPSEKESVGHLINANRHLFASEIKRLNLACLMDNPEDLLAENIQKGKNIPLEM